jgi:hypothetical protein
MAPTSQSRFKSDITRDPVASPPQCFAQDPSWRFRPRGEMRSPTDAIMPVGIGQRCKTDKYDEFLAYGNSDGTWY